MRFRAACMAASASAAVSRSRVTIHARNGEIGHVADFLVEDGDWSIHYLVVDTQNWWPGKKVLISPRSITATDWSMRTVSLAVDRKKVKDSLEYDGSKAIDRAYNTSFTAITTAVGSLSPSSGSSASVWTGGAPAGPTFERSAPGTARDARRLPRHCRAESGRRRRAHDYRSRPDQPPSRGRRP